MKNMEGIEYRPVIINKATYDLLLSQEKSGNLIAVYAFYYYTAIWQETNQPRASISYVAQGLKWSEDKVRKAKQKLQELGLIEAISKRNSDQKITGHYIKLNYYFKEATLMENYPLAKPEVNAYSNNNKILSVRGVFSPQKELITFEEKMSKKLAKALMTHRKIFRNIDMPFWIKEIAKLKREVGKPRLKKVMKWYCLHTSDSFVPKAYSAKTFRDKFYNIEDAMSRSPIINEKAVSCSEASRKIEKELSTHPFPKASKDELLRAIQISLDNYNIFLKKQQKFLSNDSQILGRFYNFGLCMVSKIGNTHSFIKSWFINVSKRIKNWPDWNGNIAAMAFNEKAKHFQTIGHQIANEYCGNTNLWDKYIIKINERIQKC